MSEAHPMECRSERTRELNLLILTEVTEVTESMSSTLKDAINRARMANNIVSIEPHLKMKAMEETIDQLLQRVKTLEDKLEIRMGLESSFRSLRKIDDAPLHMILTLVAYHTQNSTLDLRSCRNARRVCLGRHIFMYLARYHTRKSYPAIGRFIDRDHTTIIWGVRRIEKLRQSDPELDRTITIMEEFIRGGPNGPAQPLEPKNQGVVP